MSTMKDGQSLAIAIPPGLMPLLQAIRDAGGQPYFVVGLSPASERWARRFPWPLLVFNDHAQFQRLREQHRFERLKGQIRHRDEQLHGTANEMLEDYGAGHSEARQYAGRQVGPNWRCPVHFD